MQPPPDRPGHPPLPVLAALRAQIAGAVESGALATVPPAMEERIGGVRVLRFRPAGSARGRVIHFHGGAYRLGAPEVIGRYARTIADEAQVEMICPAYRLAPDHPFPAAVNDALAVIEGLEAGSPPILSGDSAGGGLAATLALLCVARGIPIAGLVLHSPWLDLTLASAAYEANAATDPLFSRASAVEGAGLYLQGHDAAHPLVSPLFGEVAGLPPTLISVGTGEVLIEDADRFAARLAAADVPVRLLRFDGMEHVAVTRNLASPGAMKTLKATVAFVAGLVGSG